MSATKSRPASQNRVALLVLGMHRSGTSAFSGVLTKLGCDQPATTMIPRPDNERGYFESQKIHLFHNGLLDSAGSSWDSYGKIGAQWLASPRKAEYHAKALSLLDEEFGASALFVLKDPRICRLLPFWLDVLADYGCRPLVAYIHRNPLQVASSLAARDGLAPDLSLLIWLRHVLEAEHGSRGLPRFFTSYPRLLANWSGVARALQDQLGLSLPRFTDSAARKVEDFLSADLRHQDDPDEKLVENPLISSWIRDVYVILERWAAAGENPDDHAALDRIRESFNTALPVFSGLADNSRELRADVKKLAATSARVPELEAQLATKDAEIVTLSDELDTARTEATTLAGQLHETRSALEKRDQEVDELRRDLEGERARATQAQERIAALTDELGKAQASIKTRFSELASMTAALVQKENDIECQNTALADLESALQERDRQIEYGRAEIAALRHSSSWRLTAPLRGLSRLLGQR